MIRSVIFVLLLAGTACAQQPEASAQRFDIAGRVVDESSGAPLAQTRVLLTPSAAQNQYVSFITAADGRFRFGRLLAGKYVLRAGRRGYPLQLLDFHLNFTTAIVVGPGADSEHVVFRLKPAAAIVGRVTDEFSEPVRRISVMLFFSSLGTGSRSTRLIRTVESDEDGEYRMVGLAPGLYYIAAMGRPWYADYASTRAARFNKQGGLPAEDGPRSPLDAAYPITFYAGASAPASASPIVLKAGERFTADLQLHAVPALHIHLRRSGGEGLGQVTVQQRLFEINEVTLPSQLSPRDAEFELSGFAPGRYILQIAEKGAPALRGEVEWLGDTAVEVDALTAAPTMANVSGAIRFDGEMERGRKPDIVLRNVQSGKSYRQAIAADGGFDIPEPLPLGAYEVGIDNAPGFFVWGISASGADTNGTRLEIVRAQPVQLSAVATTAVGNIEGVALRDGEGAAGMMIVLVPENLKDLSLYRRDQSDSDGTFTLRSVLPGRYRVLALASWEVEWSSPEFLQQYKAAGDQVRVIGGDTLRLRVKVQ